MVIVVESRGITLIYINIWLPAFVKFVQSFQLVLL
jgi:hypothetical protein